MPEVLVLGSGTSNGVPTFGLHYPPEFLANPKNHRSRSSIVIHGPGGNLLVDCPPELRVQAIKYGLFDVDATVITHTHADHIMGMDDLRSICIKTGRAMPIYCYAQYQEDIRRIFPYAFMEFPPGIQVPRFDLVEVPELSSTLQLCGMNVRSFRVWHGRTPVLGLRVNDFAYITDVSEIPPDARAELNGLDVLMIDAVRIEPHPNHFHLEKALAVAVEIGAKKTYLTHLSHDYDHDRTNAELPNGVELAYDGLRIVI